MTKSGEFSLQQSNAGPFPVAFLLASCALDDENGMFYNSASNNRKAEGEADHEVVQ